MALAPVMENLHAGTEHAEWIAQHVFYLRTTAQALAEATGVGSKSPNSEPRPTRFSHYYDMLIENLEEEQAPAIEDPFLKNRMWFASRLARHLRHGDQLGLAFEAQELDDMGALLGKRPADVKAGHRAVHQLVLDSGPERDEEFVGTFIGTQSAKKCSWKARSECARAQRRFGRRQCGASSERQPTAPSGQGGLTRHVRPRMTTPPFSSTSTARSPTPKPALRGASSTPWRGWARRSRPDELEWCIGPPLRENFVKLVGEDLAARGVELYRERFSDVGLFENEVYDGIPLVLEALAAQGAALFVASSKPRSTSTGSSTIST